MSTFSIGTVNGTPSVRSWYSYAVTVYVTCTESRFSSRIISTIRHRPLDQFVRPQFTQGDLHDEVAVVIVLPFDGVVLEGTRQ